MTPFDRFPKSQKRLIRYVLTDIDDTLTTAGRLPAVAFAAMEQLQTAGINVIPITGRPAGWCDHMARMWPIEAVVGENGAFFFKYDTREKKMIRTYWRSPSQRARDREKLQQLLKTILDKVPGCRISADQAYREADLAIDFCEDVPPLPKSAVDAIVAQFIQAGAQAKISSIHVNGWYGNYNKLAMTKRLFESVFGLILGQVKKAVIYMGDSPNDEPIFSFFPNAVGVANVRHFAGQMAHQPAWVTKQAGGQGFAEMVAHLLGP